MSLPPHPSATPVPLCHRTQSQCHPGATMSLYPIPVPPHPCPLYPDGPTLAGLTPWGAEPPSPPRSDFGYYRPENQSVCVEQPELKGHDLEFCLYGRRELLRTSGYNPNPTPRWGGRGGVLGAHSTSPPPSPPPILFQVPQDSWGQMQWRGEPQQGGDRHEEEVHQHSAEPRAAGGCPPSTPTWLWGVLTPWGDGVLSPQAASPNPTPIVLAVVAVLLVSAVAGVLLVKKYVCGGRWVPALGSPWLCGLPGGL